MENDEPKPEHQDLLLLNHFAATLLSVNSTKT